MYKECVNEISVIAVLDIRQIHKNGLYPVKIRVYNKGVQKYYKTGKTLSKEKWDLLPKTWKKDQILIRQQIKVAFDLIVRDVTDLVTCGLFSFDNLNIRLGKISGGTLNSGFSAKIEAMEREKRIGNMLYYKDVLQNVQQFAGLDIPYGSISVAWLNRYESFMLDNGASHATVAMRMRAIRAILNIAIEAGRMRLAAYPFGKNKYVIREAHSVKEKLTMDQIAKIAKYDDGNLMTEKYRDIWLFIYLCNGINVADIVNLKFRNIVDGEIRFIREKTKRTSSTIKEIRVIITPEIQRLIDKWGNAALAENYIFPIIHHYKDPLQHHKEICNLTKQINTQMKRIGSALDIEQITTYTARHSYASMLNDAGASISYISESLGHTNLNTTKVYIGSFSKEERIKYATILTQYTHS